MVSFVLFFEKGTQGQHTRSLAKLARKAALAGARSRTVVVGTISTIQTRVHSARIRGNTASGARETPSAIARSDVADVEARTTILARVDSTSNCVLIFFFFFLSFSDYIIYVKLR